MQNKLATSFGFCDKMKSKVLQLIRKGKLTSSRQSSVNVGRNVLDLNKDSFSAVCRKETGKTILHGILFILITGYGCE